MLVWISAGTSNQRSTCEWLRLVRRIESSRFAQLTEKSSAYLGSNTVAGFDNRTTGAGEVTIIVEVDFEWVRPFHFRSAAMQRVGLGFVAIAGSRRPLHQILDDARRGLTEWAQ